MGRMYKIFGITDEMYEAMKGTFLDEILIYENLRGKRQYRIVLTWCQMLVMRYRIWKFNKTSIYKLRLQRDI